MNPVHFGFSDLVSLLSPSLVSLSSLQERVLPFGGSYYTAVLTTFSGSGPPPSKRYSEASEPCSGLETHKDMSVLPPGPAASFL